MRQRATLSDHTARVLVVDDDRYNRDLLDAMLSPEGVVVECAASGEEALAIVAARPPDLILLDVMMPGMDGYAVATRLKGDPRTRSIPIIVVTALDNPDARLRGLSAGAEDYLTKPIDRAELRIRVRNLLRLKAYGDYHDKYSQMLESEVTLRTSDLVESERLYRSTFDAAPIGIVHVGLDGRWLRVNQRVCEVLGYSREELEGGIDPAALEPEANKHDRSAVRELAAGTLGPHLVEQRSFRRRNGTVVEARVNMSIHRDNDGNLQHYILVIEDITEQKALETKLRQASKMDAIGRLASGVAHDFNNLLTVVVSHSEMLAEDLDETDPMRADLNEIRAAGWRGVELTKQLLAFSRQQVLQPQIVDLAEIVTTMEKMLRRVLGEDVVMSTIHAPEASSVLLDRGQFEQVVMNLVVNARDAMPQGGTLVIETAQVLLEDATVTGQAGPHVVVSVTDTGTGMDAATQARIYEPFFTTKEFGKGTGLGLATVFGIVRQSGGTILMTSEVGVGTRFDVYFPVAKGARPVPTATRTPRPTFRGSETILLVEDEAGVRGVARTILRKYGYDVVEAQSGGDALLLCEQHPGPIHLLLTDVVMPRMSGRQLSERLLRVRPEMCVLFMSGYMDDAVVRHGVIDSSVAFIQKPITPEALAHKVRETLARGPTARDVSIQANET